MTGSAIRQLAAARDVAWVCAAFVETTVQVWDVIRQQKLSEFEARYDFGANNLAMHPDGKLIVSGISRKSGTVAAYEVPSGEQLWQIGRLPYPAGLRFSPLGDRISCTTRNRRVERIDTTSGLVLETIDNADDFFEDANRHSLVARKSGRFYLLKSSIDSKGKEFRIPKMTFSVLDVAFAPDSVYITEPGGPVRCFE